jgi:hypothetical protein
MAHKVVYERSGEAAPVVRVVESEEPQAPQCGQVLVRVTAFSVGLRVEAVTIGRWPAAVSQQRRAWDIDTARALARDAAGHLDVAGPYKLDELRTAIDHVGRPGETGMIVVTTS